MKDKIKHALEDIKKAEKEHREYIIQQKKKLDENIKKIKTKSESEEKSIKKMMFEMH